jgi:hypothetical protein
MNDGNWEQGQTERLTPDEAQWLVTLLEDFDPQGNVTAKLRRVFEAGPIEVTGFYPVRVALLPAGAPAPHGPMRCAPDPDAAPTRWIMTPNGRGRDWACSEHDLPVGPVAAGKDYGEIEAVSMTGHVRCYCGHVVFEPDAVNEALAHDPAAGRTARRAAREAAR